MKNWGDMIQHRLKEGEEIISCTLSEAELETSDGYDSDGETFAAWSHTRVFFPVIVDGKRWIGAAPRNPRDKGIDHQGGG